MKLAIEDYPGFHERMSSLREMEIGLDGAICAGGGEVRVHLPYMAACNQTLFNRITVLMRQGKMELNAKTMSLKGVQLMVEYCYTGQIEITEDNFEHIIDAALGLEFMNIVEQCVQFASAPNTNANIWCHFLRAAFRHPRYNQQSSFVPNLILNNITKIQKEAIIKGLDAAYIGEILEHGTFNDDCRPYAMNVLLEMILVDKTNIQNHKETIIRMRDNKDQNEKLILPPDVPDSAMIALMKLALMIDFSTLVEACAESMMKLRPTANVTSQVLKWMTQNTGPACDAHLKKMCFHAFCNLPLDISEDELCLMLESDCLGRSSELDILKSALKWIEHNGASDEARRRVVRLIRFGLMTKDELEEVFKSHYVTGCEVELASAMRYHLSLHSQPLTVGNTNKMRLCDPMIYIIGGQIEVNTLTKNVLTCKFPQESSNVTLSAFTEVCESPFALHSSACAEMNGFIFVSGGKGTSGAANTMYRIDCRTNTWLELERMAQIRYYHTLTSLYDTLVSVGGWDGRKTFSSIEMYCVKENTWTRLQPLPEGCMQHAASSVNGVLYISGGSRRKKLLSFNNNVWSEKTPMIQVRQAHNMASVSGMLLAVGGVVYRNDKWEDVLSIEGYDIIQDQWTELSPPILFSGFGCSVRINNWFYICGGYSYTETTRSDKIQRYNIERNEWELCEMKLPHKMKDMVAACISSE